ncbi:hypothetical protein, partial [Citrobacter meridianamericanus]|uniref:hypothetical protein n=1 Tax=Citrobacter meridianamericanus TaxID=2894201 RepID=UPI0039C4877B
HGTVRCQRGVGFCHADLVEAVQLRQDQRLFPDGVQAAWAFARASMGVDHVEGVDFVAVPGQQRHGLAVAGLVADELPDVVRIEPLGVGEQ